MSEEKQVGKREATQVHVQVITAAETAMDLVLYCPDAVVNETTVNNLLYK